MAETCNHVLYDGIVYEIVEAQSVWILELKFVVVCEEAEEVQGRQHLLAMFAVLYILGLSAWVMVLRV